jgi:hypothetical protein
VRNQALVGDQGAVELRGGIVYLRWAPGAVVTEGDVRDVMAEVSALCSGRRRPMLVDMYWMEGLGYKARNIFAAAWPVNRVAVVGTSPVDQVILNFYLARHRPACPTRFFTSASDAMTWLKTPAAAKKLPVSGGGRSHG